MLASASPARLSVLRAAGLAPTVVVSGVDESQVQSPDPTVVCATLARLKAEAVTERLRAEPEFDDRTLVLGCDSVLEFDGEIHGKPDSEQEALARWERMRGRTGTLHTGHFLIDAGRGTSAAEVASTEVTFADISSEELAAYIATGEPLHVSGSFTIDGLGGWFVERIVGDHGTVVGVSLPTLRRLLRQLDVGIPALWSAAPR